jgi:hypothetical protein
MLRYGKQGIEVTFGVVSKNRALRDRAFREILWRTPHKRPQKNISVKNNISATQETLAKVKQMGGIEMAILITGGAFFGAVLGRFFKVLVLIPAGALAIALLLVKREITGHPLLDSFLGIGLLIASLVLGYVMGLISTDVSAAAQGIREFLARSRRPASSRIAHRR